MATRPRLAVALGDPRGIGAEVVARALAAPLEADITLIGAADLLAGVPAAHRVPVGSWGFGLGEDGRRGLSPERQAGIPASAELAALAGDLAGRSIAKAVELVTSGAADAVVTAPVNKHALHLAGYRYPGVTEFLAHLAGDVEVAMMLATGPLRVVLVTTHLPLREVADRVTTERVLSIGRITAAALTQWWGLEHPRLAVCALNPHAGEGGLFGDEDTRVLAPAARLLGAAGPLPADTVFVRALRGEFDAVLAPYHDVGLTAIKVAGFGKGVNVTLGLPFPRTAPDHGTAFDIAGTGVADAGSMRVALEVGAELGSKARAARGAA
ncbi:MAG TPA: 4-hydroxythreonine-4-phosphate dehydrogenase PdxA [Gemmatimonadales bacterium]|nr:4-hydroxythreonine-4-phosphate dehydrogenase PdxA [Gemmatimonadales bacterium]